MENRDEKELVRRFHKLAYRLMAKREMKQHWDRKELLSILEWGGLMGSENKSTLMDS